MGIYLTAYLSGVTVASLGFVGLSVIEFAIDLLNILLGGLALLGNRNGINDPVSLDLYWPDGFVCCSITIGGHSKHWSSMALNGTACFFTLVS